MLLWLYYRLNWLTVAQHYQTVELGIQGQGASVRAKLKDLAGKIG
jgi:hypothetical protein